MAYLELIGLGFIVPSQNNKNKFNKLLFGKTLYKVSS